MKKISAATIRRAVDTSKTIEEISEKVGVTPAELKTICTALNIALPPTPTPKPEPRPVVTAPVRKKYTGELVTDSILAIDGNPPNILFVDKSAYTLYLLRHENGRLFILDTFDCKTGKNDGDKQERGDHRTPEGVFFFTKKLTRSEIEAQVGKANAYQYGDLAFVTDFPNQVDRLKGKNGSGIWLHGTDEPFDSTPSRDTRGCVVTTNETIRKLSSYIQIATTPLIVIDTIRKVTPPDVESERNTVLSMMEEWRKSWSEKRIADYIHFYSTRFASQGMNLDQWRARKEQISKINGDVKIALSNFTVLREKDSMVVRFTQDYKADNVSNLGVKTLYFIRENDSWEIVSEFFRRAN